MDNILSWLKECINTFEKWEVNPGNDTLEMTQECRDAIVEGLKRINTYITQTFDVEYLAEQVHNAWWATEKNVGLHAPNECEKGKTERKAHPGLYQDVPPANESTYKFYKWCPSCHTEMYPYAELPEYIKEYDRVTVRTVLDAMKKVGVG